MIRFRRQERQHDTADEHGVRILPPDIRYALSYDEAKLRRKHVEQLFRSGFNGLGFYLVMKVSAEADSVQREVLQDVAELNFDIEKLDTSSRGVQHALSLFDEPSESGEQPYVPGGKLAQVSRHGFGNWTERFDKALDGAEESFPDSQLFMVASSPYVGFDVIAAHSLARERPLGILKPERFNQPDKAIGFMLTPELGGVAIRELSSGFERPASGVVFDDVLNGGNTRRKVDNFWTQDGSSSPHYVASLIVSAPKP